MKVEKRSELIQRFLQYPKYCFATFKDMIEQESLPMVTNNYISEEEIPKVYSYILQRINEAGNIRAQANYMFKCFPAIKDFCKESYHDYTSQIENIDDKTRRENLKKKKYMMYCTQSVGDVPILFSSRKCQIQLGFEALEDIKYMTGPLTSVIEVNDFVLSGCLANMLSATLLGKKNNRGDFYTFRNKFFVRTLLRRNNNNRLDQKYLSILQSDGSATGLAPLSCYALYESDDEFLIVNGDYTIWWWLENDEKKSNKKIVDDAYGHTRDASYKDLGNFIDYLNQNYKLLGEYSTGDYLDSWFLSSKENYKSLKEEGNMPHPQLYDVAEVQYTGKLEIEQYFGTNQQYDPKNRFIVARFIKQ